MPRPHQASKAHLIHLFRVPLKLLFGPVGQQCPRHPSLTSFKTALWNVPSGPPVARSFIFFKGFKTSGFQSCRLALFVQPAQPSCSQNRGSAAPGVSPFITVQALDPAKWCQMLVHQDFTWAQAGEEWAQKGRKTTQNQLFGQMRRASHSFQKKNMCLKMRWFSQFACFLLKRYNPKVPKYTFILHVPVGGAGNQWWTYI